MVLKLILAVLSYTVSLFLGAICALVVFAKSISTSPAPHGGVAVHIALKSGPWMLWAGGFALASSVCFVFGMGTMLELFEDLRDSEPA